MRSIYWYIWLSTLNPPPHRHMLVSILTARPILPGRDSWLWLWLSFDLPDRRSWYGPVVPLRGKQCIKTVNVCVVLVKNAQILGPIQSISCNVRVMCTCCMSCVPSVGDQNLESWRLLVEEHIAKIAKPLF